MTALSGFIETFRYTIFINITFIYEYNEINKKKNVRIFLGLNNY